MFTEKDNVLVKRFIEKADHKAFEKIYNKYFEIVYRFVFSRVGNRTWTEDIVSETFITLTLTLKSYDAKSKLQSFIIGIAVNKIKQFWTKSRLSEEIDFNEDTIVILDEDKTDFKREKKIKLIVEEILPNLKENYQQVLTERFINCNSIKDTAVNLNISEANVRVIQNRALKKATELANQYLNQKKPNETN